MKTTSITQHHICPVCEETERQRRAFSLQPLVRLVDAEKVVAALKRERAVMEEAIRFGKSETERADKAEVEVKRLQTAVAR